MNGCVENVRRPFVTISPRGEPFVTDVGAPAGPCGAAQDEHCTVPPAEWMYAPHKGCPKLHHTFVTEEV